MTARMHIASTDVKLLVDGTTLTAAESTDADLMCRFDLTGLSANAAHTYQVQVDGKLLGPVGRFRTMPSGAPSGTPCNFTCAIGGDANTGSTHNSFHRVRMADPLFFIYLGDRNYENTSTNSPATFQTTYDRVVRGEPQARLHAEVPIVYVWDDHDYGANNSDGTSASKPAVAAVYRSRVPSYALPHATAIYHTFDVGRVRFIVTDQRSEASPDSDTDNSSKSMLGATQKTWFKNLLSNSPGMLIVWVCPRWFRSGAPVAGAGNWCGFSTERTELVDHIQANCSGRVVVLSADLHTLAIDDGTNHDFATSGSEPLPTFQVAPLDQSSVSGGETYSHGEFVGNGQWGTMAIADSGGATIGVTWTGFDSTGAQLVQYAFTVTP